MAMSLFERVLAHLRGRPEIADLRSETPADLELKAACAVLLLEAAYGDEDYAWAEHRVIVDGLRRAFGLGRRETLHLLDQAEGIRPPVVALRDVTDVLRDRFDPEQRVRVLTLLWRVVEADGVLEDWENAFATHVAAAVGLTPEQADRARDAARARKGIGT
jgi:uncharacterized tellurite resistance protein B-like protein